MYKQGQIITIGGRRYRITQCKNFKSCVECRDNNYIIPCITYEALIQHKFSMNKCWEKIPRNCFPKLMGPK